MSHFGLGAAQGRRPAVEGGASRSGRRRWFKVRIVTEDGSYLGSLRLEPGSSALRQLLDDDRSYLSLWDARREGSAAVEEFLAIHKVAIRYAVVIGHDAVAGAAGEA